MKKQTKLLSKFAVLLATLGAGAVLASVHVVAHADGTSDGWAETTEHTGYSYVPGLTDAQKAHADQIGSQPQSEANKRALAKSDAALDKLDAIYKKQQAEYDAQMEKIAAKRGISVGPNATDTSATTTAKKTAKKTVAKKVVAKKASKKVTKKHAKKLFTVQVKAKKIYAYKSTDFTKKSGRQVEKKGTKLAVYKVIKKGHKTFYKVYGGRVITANKSAVSVIPQTMVQK